MFNIKIAIENIFIEDSTVYMEYLMLNSNDYYEATMEIDCLDRNIYSWLKEENIKPPCILTFPLHHIGNDGDIETIVEKMIHHKFESFIYKIKIFLINLLELKKEG